MSQVILPNLSVELERAISFFATCMAEGKIRAASHWVDVAFNLYYRGASLPPLTDA